MSDLYSIAIDADSDLLTVKGELTFVTANAIFQQSQALFAPISALDIDLANVTRSDSAGLALLVEWIRSARQKNKTIVFHNVPDQILAIAGASGVDELLPIQ